MSMMYSYLVIFLNASVPADMMWSLSLPLSMHGCPVDETTTDIICIKCKKDDSDSPNEIVLCDRCGIGEYIPGQPYSHHTDQGLLVQLLYAHNALECHNRSDPFTGFVGRRFTLKVSHALYTMESHVEHA